MNRRNATRMLSLLPLAAAWPTSAQAQTKLRVAWVSTERQGAPSANLDAFRGGMRDAGYVEGRDFVIELWAADGSGERVIQMVPAIRQSNPDIIIAAGGLALFALYRAGVKTPMVFSLSGDPVVARLIDSYGRPGGTMTGISLFTLALVGKRMEILKEIVPGIRRIAVIGSSQHPGETKERDEAQAAARAQGLSLRYFPVTSGADLEAALADIARGRDEAVIAFADGFMLGYAGRLAEFSLKHRIPTVDGWAPFAEAGNLMTYGPVFADVYRRLASHVDRINKGAKPGDLPVELPTKIELVVNLKTAKALGITIPPAVLARADVVIR
jgi:putative tryptophan/tyrosine transport system substrate-binding protein